MRGSNYCCDQFGAGKGRIRPVSPKSRRSYPAAIEAANQTMVRAMLSLRHTQSRDKHRSEGQKCLKNPAVLCYPSHNGHTSERSSDPMAVRPLLLGISLILALVLIVLSILLVNSPQPMHQSEGLVPSQPSHNPQSPSLQ